MVIPKLPIPTDPEKVLKVLKKIGEFFLNVLGFAKKASETDSTNNSSLENIDSIMEIFSGLKSDIHKRSLEIEDSVKAEVDSYLEEVVRILESNREIAEKYNIKFDRIKRKINNVTSNLQGIVDKEVSRTVSLDNSECREIMKMVPGARKEQAVNAFFDSAIRNALAVYCSAVRKALDEIFDETNDEILGTIEIAKKDIANQMELMQSVNEGNYKEKTSQIMSEAEEVCDICDIVEDLLTEA